MATITLIQSEQEQGRILIFRRYFTLPGEHDILYVDAYVILTDHYVIFCDTLLCPQDMEQICSQIMDHMRGKQLIVINSHADWDHCWGNGYFSLDGRKQRSSGLSSSILIAQEYCRKRLLSEQMQQLLQEYRMLDETFQQVDIIAPTLTFNQNLQLHCDDITLELFAAPGHSIDHCALWIPQWRILFAFDALELPIPLLEDEMVAGLMEETLHHFLALQPRHIFCSHTVSGSLQIMQQNLEYIHQLKYRCKAYLNEVGVASWLDREDVDWSEIAQRIYPWTDESQFYCYAHNNNVRMMLRWLSAFGENKKEKE